MLDFVGKRYWFFLFSAIIIVPGLISLAIPPRMKVGLEFTSGSSQTVSFLNTVPQDDLRAEMAGQGHGDAIIQGSPKEAYLVETKPLTEDERTDLEERLRDGLGLPQDLDLRRSLSFPKQDQPDVQVQAFLFPDVNEVDASRLTQELTDAGYPDTSPQRARLDTYLVRTKVLATLEERQALEEALEARFGPQASYDFDLVSPIVASERARNAFYAVVAASVAILLYMTWAFRRQPHPVRYGAFAVLALVHDSLVTVGIFSILGKVAGMEVDSMFITALLTIIGFSVHDTIVVFDRIRENTARAPGLPLETTVNNSLNETLSRSLNTSLTLFFMLFAMALIGGVTLRSFVLALLVGITAGTYSSIAIASQFLVVWERMDWKKLWPFRAKTT